jgi:hypothetical protein
MLPAPSKYQGEADMLLVAGVMRSGQTWLCFLLSRALNARFVEPYCLLRGIVHTGHDYVRAMTYGNTPGIATTPITMVVKTHAPPDPYFSLTRKVVLIVRDPRDTITSAALRFHVMKTTGSDVEEDAQALSLLPAPATETITLKHRISRWLHGNRLIGIILTARRWRDFHEAWRQVPFCHVVRFEDLVRNSVGELAKTCEQMGATVAPSHLEDTVHRLSMAEIKRHHTATDPSKRIGFRKGEVGDFRNHLSRLELAIIRRYCRSTAEHFGYQL